MCKICTDWENGKITSQEALDAAANIGEAHREILVDKIMNKEVPHTEVDEELETIWHNSMYPEE